MTQQDTLSIIKPDAVKASHIGSIIQLLEEAGLKLVAQKMIQLTEEQAQAFYAEHRERPFFATLVAFMISAPIVVQVLRGENAIARNRETMGDTNPAKAAPHTIRAIFGTHIESNAVHGSDSEQSAAREIQFFFKENAPFDF
ncbi:MAG: nucleoside-diphosphate kinase [Gammaproteobacteria bacterium]